ncbi:MAG: WecB/TagA/CpsF family glycosyltransferase [Oscillospiraceae bacterium]|nr:WecB/TagA/CpsF family glycosyltransferase [Oscillospiraceae bacterium]
MRADILGVPFDAVTPEEAVRRGMELMEGGGGRVVTPNPEIVWKCHTDPAAREAVVSADLILADGVGILKAAKKLGRPLRDRVLGIEWFYAMLALCAEKEKSVFFLGGKPGVAGQAAKNAAQTHPALKVCGAHDGFFTDEDAVAERIRQAGPDFLAVSLGAPKQELWMARNAPKLPGVLMAGLGGSLDILAGGVKRAPKIFSKLGLEWLYRALRQPSRIPRLLVIPKFLRLVGKTAKREKKHG